MAAVSWVLETSFPDPIGALMSVFALATEFTIEYGIPIGCITEYDHHAYLLVTTAGPLLMMSALGACFLCLKRIGLSKAGKKCFSAALLIAFLLAPTASTTIFRTFPCEELDSGERFLTAVSDPLSILGDPHHTRMQL